MDYGGRKILHHLKIQCKECVMKLCFFMSP